MSKKLICVQPAGISRAAIKNATPPLLEEDVSWFLALLILVCDEKTTGGTE